jgi:hypothetical protein
MPRSITYCAVELARLLALGDERAVAGRREERGDAGAAGAHALGERALRHELDLELAREELRSNSAFSPTYDETILRICFVCSSSPRPQSSTPALLETQVSPFTPFATSALMRFSGMPHNPKPPTTSSEPSRNARGKP